MDLTTMRTLFHEHTSDLSSGLDDSEVDEILNRAYQDRIPADIGGEFTEGTWELTCTASTASYAYPGYVIAPTAKGVNIRSSVTGGNEPSIRWLDVETDQDVWNRDDRHWPPRDGFPTSILLYGRTATLSPRPSTDYIVNIPARVGPSAVIPSSGIDDSNHAMAVVTSAAVEFLVKIGNREAAADQSDLYDGFVELLLVKAHSRSNHRRPGRSF